MSAFRGRRSGVHHEVAAAETASPGMAGGDRSAFLMAAGTQFILLTESPAFEKSLVAFKGGIKNENFDCGA
jgi:hypothetical protein